MFCDVESLLVIKNLVEPFTRLPWCCNGLQSSMPNLFNTSARFVLWSIVNTLCFLFWFIDMSKQKWTSRWSSISKLSLGILSSNLTVEFHLSFEAINRFVNVANHTYQTFCIKNFNTLITDRRISITWWMVLLQRRAACSNHKHFYAACKPYQVDRCRQNHPPVACSFLHRLHCSIRQPGHAFGESPNQALRRLQEEKELSCILPQVQILHHGLCQTFCRYSWATKQALSGWIYPSSSSSCLKTY